jgi:LysR family transcriptional regulator, nitrogen assimilation regulatory protein
LGPSMFVEVRQTCRVLVRRKLYQHGQIHKAERGVASLDGRERHAAHRPLSGRRLNVMDLRQLRYFVGIVQSGSLSRAADQLHVAQSAISHHLAGLESELNRQLVTRGPKGVILTDAGEVLYRHAEAILRHVDFAKRDAMSAQEVPSGRVSIGFPSALSAILGYELFARVHRDYPQILLHVTDGNSSLLHERLGNSRLDIAILFAERAERGLAIEPLLSEELFYVTKDKNRSPITLADAANHPLLVPGPGSGIQRVLQHAFTERGLTLAPVGEIDVLGALRQAVAASIGDTILPWSALYEGSRKIVLTYRRFADVMLVRTVALCFSEFGQRSPAIEAVASTLRSLVRDLVESNTWQGVALIVTAPGLSNSPLPP